MFSVVMTGSSSFNSLSCVEVQRVVQWSTGGSRSAEGKVGDADGDHCLLSWRGAQESL